WAWAQLHGRPSSAIDRELFAGLGRDVLFAPVLRRADAPDEIARYAKGSASTWRVPEEVPYSFEATSGIVRQNRRIASIGGTGRPRSTHGTPSPPLLDLVHCLLPFHDNRENHRDIDRVAPRDRCQGLASSTPLDGLGALIR